MTSPQEDLFLVVQSSNNWASTNCSWEVRNSTTIFSPTLKSLSIYYDPFPSDDILDRVVSIDASNLVSLYILLIWQFSFPYATYLQCLVHTLMLLIWDVQNKLLIEQSSLLLEFNMPGILHFLIILFMCVSFPYYYFFLLIF